MNATEATMNGELEPAAVEKSIRPARHRGYLTRWRAADLNAIDVKIAELRRLLAALDNTDVEQPELF